MVIIKPDSAPMGISRELREGMIRSIVIGVMIASLVFLGGALLVYREILSRAFVVVLSTWLVGAFNLILLRRGYLKTVSVFMVCFLWFMASVGVYTAGGLHAPILTGYLVVILLGWLLVGVRGGQVAFAASLIFILVIFYAEVNEYL
ncbi:MAG: hypothetical protein JNK32_00415, partial [Anaerolineales bacterium]|nr:hypothetical protein [Anaerolineales bacterium]